VKRWVAAVVAVLFLSTATLHVFAHHGAADTDCGVCHLQQASLPSAPAPAIVSAPLPFVAVAELASPQEASAPRATAAARAPPALPA
jgi:hypothetical protein